MEGSDDLVEVEATMWGVREELSWAVQCALDDRSASLMTTQMAEALSSCVALL